MPKWFAKNILFSKTIGSLGLFMYTKQGVAPSLFDQQSNYKEVQKLSWKN